LSATFAVMINVADMSRNWAYGPVALQLARTPL